MTSHLILFFRQLGMNANTRGRKRARAIKLQPWRRVVQTVCVALLVFLSAGIIKATPLESYQAQVWRALQSLDALPQWKKVERQADYTKRTAAAVAQLRETLLPINTVEWNNNTLRLDNKWLAEALARYEQIPAADSARREAELAQIADRLKAINERLTELGGPGVNGPSKTSRSLVFV